jgi:hypothetical protein
MLFRNTNHVTDKLNIPNLPLDWSQLCILSARQCGKMASSTGKAFSVLAFYETKSVVTVKRQFRRRYRRSA